MIRNPFWIFLAVPFFLAANRACFTESMDVVSSFDEARIFRARAFVDVNSDGVYNVGIDLDRPNHPMSIEIAGINREGASQRITIQPVTTDANGTITFNASAWIVGAGLYRLSLFDAEGLQHSILRQHIPFSLATGSVANEEYCAAYSHVFARKAVHESLGRANFLGLSGFQGIGYVFAGADLVEASAIAALQRNYAGVRVSFKREASPPYFPGQGLALGRTCSVDRECQSTEMCEDVFPPNDVAPSRRCVEMSACALRPRNGRYRRSVQFGTWGNNGYTTGLCSRRSSIGLRGQAAVDSLNSNISSSGEPTLVYVDQADTLETPGKNDRAIVDAVEDLGRTIGYSASHEVGHSLGLVSSADLRGSRSALQIGSVGVTGPDHPDPFDLTAATRIPARSIMFSGADRQRLVESIHRRSDTQPGVGGAPCAIQPLRVPASFGEFSDSYLDLAVPGP
jgi:hypothetical protein